MGQGHWGSTTANVDSLALAFQQCRSVSGCYLYVMGPYDSHKLKLLFKNWMQATAGSSCHGKDEGWHWRPGRAGRGVAQMSSDCSPDRVAAGACSASFTEARLEVQPEQEGCPCHLDVLCSAWDLVQLLGSMGIES